MFAAHWSKPIVRCVGLLVMRHLQSIRENRHLERIGDVHDLSGKVVGCTVSCRISSLLCILYFVSQHVQTGFKHISLTTPKITAVDLKHIFITTSVSV